MLAFVGVANVHAARAERVAITRPADADSVVVEIAVRVAAELRRAGFEVVPGNASAPEHAGLLAHFDIRRRDDSGAIAVRIVDRLAAKTTSAEIPVIGAGSPAVIAIRAVELLRASLLELALPPPSRRPQADAASPPRAMSPAVDALLGSVEPEPPATVFHVTGLTLGVTALSGLTGEATGLSWAPRLTTHVRVAEGWAVRLSGHGPSAGSRIANGTSHARLVTAALALSLLRAWRLAPQLSVMAAIGGGGILWHVDGEGPPPSVGQRQAKVTGQALLGAGLAWRFGRRIFALLEAQSVVPLPGAVVRFDGDEAARATPFLLTTSLNIGTGF